MLKLVKIICAKLDQWMVILFAWNEVLTITFVSVCVFVCDNAVHETGQYCLGLVVTVLYTGLCVNRRCNVLKKCWKLNPEITRQWRSLVHCMLQLMIQKNSTWPKYVCRCYVHLLYSLHQNNENLQEALQFQCAVHWLSLITFDISCEPAMQLHGNRTA